MLRYLVEDKATLVVVVGILEGDGSTRVLSHGNAGSGARPLGTRSVFEIGSITKTFTRTILADMVNKGEVSLSDPISKYLGQCDRAVAQRAIDHAARPGDAPVRTAAASRQSCAG